MDGQLEPIGPQSTVSLDASEKFPFQLLPTQNLIKTIFFTSEWVAVLARIVQPRQWARCPDAIDLNYTTFFRLGATLASDAKIATSADRTAGRVQFISVR